MSVLTSSWGIGLLLAAVLPFAAAAERPGTLRNTVRESIQTASTGPSVPVLLDRFERGGWTDGDAPQLSPEELVALLKNLRQGAALWVKALGAEQEQRRRLTIATYVLHILSAQDDPFLWQSSAGRPPISIRATNALLQSKAYAASRPREVLPAAALIEWASNFLRETPPLPAERWWHLGAIALLERAHAIPDLDLQIADAQKRFPAEDRWALARGISVELRTWPEARDERPFSIMPALGTQVVARYKEALAHSSVRQEAQLRLAYFTLRLGHVDTAVGYFADVGQPTEPFLRYQLYLLEGLAFEQARRPDEAIDAYRRALAEIPNAQSAAFALAAALACASRGSEAALLTARTLDVRPAPADPWVLYALPDVRFWSRVTTELRRAITR